MDDVQQGEQRDDDGSGPADTAAPLRRRRWALAGAGLATLAAASTGLTLALTGGDGGAGASADEMPSPRSITRDGVTYEVGLTSPAAAALDPDDPKAVTVYVFAGESAEQPECSMLEPRARIVEQTSSAVRIATYVYRVPIEGDESISCGFVTSTPGADYRAMTMHLSEPLGQRRLVDEQSGEDIGHLEHDYDPTPGWLPSGFAPRDLDPMLDLYSGFTPEGDFRVSRQYVRGRDGFLDVDVRSSTGCCEMGDAVSHTDVGGHEATITENDYHRCVSWSPLPGIVTDVCSTRTLLPADDLLRVARSVPEP